MINIGVLLDNRTICDVFGVANMGGIRVNNSRNLIVLISNNTDPTYRNEWKDDVLQFVGMGSTGPQKLDRQNKTLANSKRNGMAVYLFEVFEKSKYEYAGEVELADEPYVSDQQDAAGDGRFVWIFPLSKKSPAEMQDAVEVHDPRNHLPHGAYAVIDADLTDAQAELVNEALDRLRQAGVPVLSQRDIELKRHEKALAVWHEKVIDQFRSAVKELIADRKRAAKARNSTFSLVDDELKISSASTEAELRAALQFLDRDDSVSANQMFDQTMRSVPMPEPPTWLKESSDPVQVDRITKTKTLDRSKFKDFR
jgi:hypothetical protein